jgi:XTP/dITP diphosphohydrolase
MARKVKPIYLVTSNKNKFKEFKEILGFKLKRVSLELDEIQAIEVEKVVEHKTKQAFNKIKKPVICEDTGLYFKEWNGLPGALAKLFDKTIGYRNLCKILKSNRKAKAQTVIGYFDGKNYKSFIGEISGRIAKSPRGKNGFGWDVIFIPHGYSKTFAQMSSGEKNQISMRKIALEKLRSFLTSLQRS